MYRLSQVANLLNCSLANVYALVEKGKLTVISTGAGGKGFRVTEEELSRFKEESTKREREKVPIKRQPSRPQLRHIKL